LDCPEKGLQYENDKCEVTKVPKVVESLRSAGFHIISRIP
jgi:hypothetical protein